MSALADAYVLYEQKSSPLGLCGQEEMTLLESTVSTLAAPSPTQGYRFAFWIVYGVEQRDMTGRAVNPSLPFILSDNTTAVAQYYLETTDSNTNSIPDWWEYEFLGTLASNTFYDVDGDGFVLAEEYRRDYHPSITNEIRDGGFSLVMSPAARVIIDGGLSTYKKYSVPLGLIPSTDLVLSNGTPISVSDVYGKNGGYSFAYWTVNGERLSDTTGRSLSAVDFVLQSNMTVIAHFVPSTQDSDGDNLYDWYELNMFGSTNLNASSDVDSDGFDLTEEYRRDYHPSITNEIRDGGFSLARSRSSRVIVNQSFSEYKQYSEPLGLVPSIDQVLSNGTPISVSDVYGKNGGYSFAYWTVNGERLSDATGRSLSAVDFVLQSNVTVIAHFVPSAQDSDGDNLSDWYELNMFGSTNLNASSDVDGDGFDLTEEYRRDYHPSITNEIRDGGFSLARSQSSRVIVNQSFSEYKQYSEPLGLVPSADQVLSNGTVVVVSDAYGSAGGYTFTHWMRNGVRQEDVTGRALGFFSFIIETNTDVVASFIPSVQDKDGDNLLDWYELNMFGSTNLNALSDSDGDDFDLAEEYRRDYHPLVTDNIRNGGFSLVLSPQVLVNLSYFPRVRDVLVNGRSTPFFSTDTSTTGTFSTVANSHPALGDWDGDGDLDLFVGGSNGVMRVFENAGSPTVINWVERPSEFAALAGCWTNVLNPAPTLGDWNHDGLADLAVGGGTGTVWLVRSPGNWESANLTVELQTSFDTGAGSAVPAFADVNDDGWVDLLVLTEAGTVWCFVHTQSTSVPYAPPPYTADLLGIPVPDARGIATADVNHDGVTDILISDDNGNIWEFHGNGL